MIAIEGIALLLIWVTTELHAWWFRKNYSTGPWFHFLFATSYFAPVILIGWFWEHNILLLLALTAERFVFYNFLLNLERGEAFFYLSVNSRNPSWWDGIELKWAKYYPIIWIVSTIGFAFLQFIL